MPSAVAATAGTAAMDTAAACLEAACTDTTATVQRFRAAGCSIRCSECTPICRTRDSATVLLDIPTTARPPWVMRPNTIAHTPAGRCTDASAQSPAPAGWQVWQPQTVVRFQHRDAAAALPT